MNHLQNYTFFNHFLFIKRQHILKLLYLNTIIYASIEFFPKNEKQ